MQGGKLRHRLTLQAPVVTQASDGGQVVTWQDVEQVWAQIEPLSMREMVLAQQVQSRVTHKIRLRYQATLPPTYQLVSTSGRVFALASVRTIDERNRVTEVMAVEQGATG